MRQSLFVFSSFILLSVLSVIDARAGSESAMGSEAVSSDISDQSQINTKDKPAEPVDSYGMMEMNSRSPKMLILEGEQALRAGNLDLALAKVKRSLLLDNDDMDAHCLYAQILDEQLSSQSERDPNLFNTCVEEWLAIMRNRYGEEKHMRIHGINPITDLYHDEERSIPAKTELIKLTGSAPGTFETDAHYLKRVLLPAEATVTAKVMKKNRANGIVGPQASVPTTNN